MSSNTSKLLRVLSSQKKMSLKLYETLMNDSSVSMEVKKKVTLYYKGDKRLSVVKFQELIKKKGRKSQKGGGWTFGIVEPNQYGITGISSPVVQQKPLTSSPISQASSPPVIMFGTPSPSPSPSTPVIMFETPSPSPPPPVIMFGTPSPQPQTHLTQQSDFYLESTGYKLKIPAIGSGAFADVYSYTYPDSSPVHDRVVKIFRQTSLGTNTVQNTIACINEFVSTFPNLLEYTSLAAPTSTTQPYIFVTKTLSSQDVIGYIMRALTPIKTDSLTYVQREGNEVKKCIEFEEAKIMIAACQFEVGGKRFIHGDIKIENLLRDRESVVMTDMDSVFVYNTESLNHISGTPYTRAVDMTPACTHPIYPWYAHVLRGWGLGKDTYYPPILETISRRYEGKYHMYFWDIMWANMGDSPICITMKNVIMKVLDRFYAPNNTGGETDAYVQYVHFQLKTNRIPWLQAQLAKIDMYSLGASALFHYVKQVYNKKQMITDKIPEKELLDFAIETMQASLVPPPEQGGGKSRKKKGAGDQGSTTGVVVYKSNGPTTGYNTYVKPGLQNAIPIDKTQFNTYIQTYILDKVSGKTGDIDQANTSVRFDFLPRETSFLEPIIKEGQNELSWPQ